MTEYLTLFIPLDGYACFFLEKTTPIAFVIYIIKGVGWEFIGIELQQVEKVRGIFRVHPITFCQIMMETFIITFVPYPTFSTIYFRTKTNQLFTFKLNIFFDLNLFVFNHFYHLQTIVCRLDKMYDLGNNNWFLFINKQMAIVWMSSVLALFHYVDDILFFLHSLWKSTFSTMFRDRESSMICCFFVN